MEPEESTAEPPFHDMIHLQFSSMDAIITVPYCEVANGDVKSVEPDSIHIISPTGEDVTLTNKEFSKMVEKAWGSREIVGISLQMKGDTEVHEVKKKSE